MQNTRALYNLYKFQFTAINIHLNPALAYSLPAQECANFFFVGNHFLPIGRQELWKRSKSRQHRLVSIAGGARIAKHSVGDSYLFLREKSQISLVLSKSDNSPNFCVRPKQLPYKVLSVTFNI